MHHHHHHGSLLIEHALGQLQLCNAGANFCYDLQIAKLVLSPAVSVAGGLLCGGCFKPYVRLLQFVQRFSSSTADCEKLDVSYELERQCLQPSMGDVSVSGLLFEKQPIVVCLLLTASTGNFTLHSIYIFCL